MADRLGDWLARAAAEDRTDVVRQAAEDFVKKGRDLSELDEPGAALALLIVALAKRKEP